MHSRILLLFLVFTSLGMSAQEQIPWSEGDVLTWSHFEPRKNPGFGFRALTYSGIRYDVMTVDGQVEIEINCYFIPSRSWVQEGFEKPYLLRHEQLHFDITEIFARKMRKEMAAYEMSVSDFMRQNLSRELESVYDRLYEEMVKMQKQYDAETDHSLKREEQKRWEEKVAALLSELDDYASSVQ